MDKNISEKLLYQVGKDLLGKEAEKVDDVVIKAAGLLGVMGNVYATEKGIKCDNVVTDYKTLTINFMKDKKVIDGFTITTDDLANPKEWHNKLLKECGKEVPED